MLGLDLLGNVERSVWELQVILKTLGAPIPVDAQGNPDKTFGPKTQKTWSLSASSLGLDPRFERVSASVASVDKDTYDVLREAYLLRKAPKPVGASDFERLNNAIVLMGRKLPANKDAQALAADWAGYSTGQFWRTMNELEGGRQIRLYWETYTDVLTGAGPNKIKISTEERSRVPTPASVKPGGFWRTATEQAALTRQVFWTPALDYALAAGASVVATSKQKLKELLQEAGQEFAKGAIKEGDVGLQNKALVYGGIALLGAGVWYALKGREQAR